MADTIFIVYRGQGLLVKDFGSKYPRVLAALQKTTREQGDALRPIGAQLQIPTSKGTALFKSYVGSSYNPTTNVKEYGVEYLGLTEIVKLNEAPR